MSRRNSPNEIADLAELSCLRDSAFDPRQGRKASAKKHRYIRPYQGHLIRNTLAQLSQVDSAEAKDPALAATPDGTLRHEDEA